MGLGRYTSVLSILAALGFAPDSAAVYAARAAHHSARLLYKTTQGELLVTLLVGKRSSNNAVMLYVCECVEQALQPSDMANISTGMKLIFFSFRSLLAAGATRGRAGGASSSGALRLGSSAFDDVRSAPPQRPPLRIDASKAIGPVVHEILSSTRLSTCLVCAPLSRRWGRRKHKKKQQEV